MTSSTSRSSTAAWHEQRAAVRHRQDHGSAAHLWPPHLPPRRRLGTTLGSAPASSCARTGSQRCSPPASASSSPTVAQLDPRPPSPTVAQFDTLLPSPTAGGRATALLVVTTGAGARRSQPHGGVERAREGAVGGIQLVDGEAAHPCRGGSDHSDGAGALGFPMGSLTANGGSPFVVSPAMASFKQAQVATCEPDDTLCFFFAVAEFFVLTHNYCVYYRNMFS